MTHIVLILADNLGWCELGCQDPKEETDVGTEHSWVRGPLRKVISEFQQSLRAHPPIPPGAPDDYDPRRPGR